MLEKVLGGILYSLIQPATYIRMDSEALFAELAIGEELALLLRMIVWAC